VLPTQSYTSLKTAWFVVPWSCQSPLMAILISQLNGHVAVFNHLIPFMFCTTTALKILFHTVPVQIVCVVCYVCVCVRVCINADVRFCVQLLIHSLELYCVNAFQV